MWSSATGWDKLTLQMRVNRIYLQCKLNHILSGAWYYCSMFLLEEEFIFLFPLQVCAKGFFLSELNLCLPCNCKGHADYCDDITGVCTVSFPTPIIIHWSIRMIESLQFTSFPWTDVFNIVRRMLPSSCNILSFRTAGTTAQETSVKCVKMAICWPPAWTDTTPADPVPAPSPSPPISELFHSCFCSHKAATVCWQAVGNVWNTFPCVSGQFCSALWQRRCRSAVQVPRGLRRTFVWEVSAEVASNISNEVLCAHSITSTDYWLRWAELHDSWSQQKATHNCFHKPAQISDLNSENRVIPLLIDSMVKELLARTENQTEHPKVDFSFTHSF